MHDILLDLERVEVYMDDVIVCGSGMLEQNACLEKVLKRTKRAGLNTNKDKSRFRQEQLNFLGHVVSKRGV